MVGMNERSEELRPLLLCSTYTFEVTLLKIFKNEMVCISCYKY